MRHMNKLIYVPYTTDNSKRHRPQGGEGKRMRLAARLNNGREYIGIFTAEEILKFDPAIIEIREYLTGKVIWTK